MYFSLTLPLIPTNEAWDEKTSSDLFGIVKAHIANADQGTGACHSWAVPAGALHQRTQASHVFPAGAVIDSLRGQVFGDRSPVRSGDWLAAQAHETNEEFHQPISKIGSNSFRNAGVSLT